MSTAQHTPGPWWVTDSGVRDAGGYICHTLKAQHYEGQDERYERETAERAANADLIAAAPDLLAQLRSAREFIAGFHGDDTQEGIQEMLDAYDAAIAKAAGGPS